MQDVTLLQLDLGLLLAGAKERGELEMRLKGLLAALDEANGTIILVIDEIHMLVGTGSVTKGRGTVGGANSAGLDVSNMLKPALSSGRIRCIGATTLKEHRKYIESDPALARRFQPVVVDEPSHSEALQVCCGQIVIQRSQDESDFQEVTLSGCQMFCLMALATLSCCCEDSR
jgi:ATP-dependent Clp protease ATP-binding subunit ClpC